MSQTIIKVEGLGKKYIIGHQQRQQGLRHILNDSLTNLGRKLFRPSFKRDDDLTHEEFWALKDVSFDIKQGDVVGIIGHNGAGKSTLLKILSRITEPTTGSISVKGRIASLLEVGTGFHPDLTGRENIYLNGAILGMSREEIRRKFDEIVDFAEIKKFLDTPVKRYSSGMYVRLAFAVAAHLEPEILIVDEVLAVGDAEFQKKCLGKMGDIASKEGRTVLFVSHNMQAVSQLTINSILLKQGKVFFQGKTDKVIPLYLRELTGNSKQKAFYESTVNKKENYIAWAKVKTSEPEGLHMWGNSLCFEFRLNITIPQESICFSFQIVNERQQSISSFILCDSQTPFGREAGHYLLKCIIPKSRLYMGSYTLTTWLASKRSDTLWENLTAICPFDISLDNYPRPEYEWRDGDSTYIEDALWSDVQYTDFI